MNSELLAFYFGVYMDRALTALAARFNDEDDTVGDGIDWTFDEWFAAGGDLERVGRTREIAMRLAESLDMSELGLSEICYNVLEDDLEYYVQIYVDSKAESPSNDEIYNFIASRVEALRVKSRPQK